MIPNGKLSDLNAAQLSKLSEADMHAMLDREDQQQKAIALNLIAQTQAGKRCTEFSLSQRHPEVSDMNFRAVLAGLGGLGIVENGKRTNQVMDTVEVPQLRGIPTTAEVSAMIAKMTGKQDIKAAQSTDAASPQDGAYTVPVLMERELAANYPEAGAYTRCRQVAMTSKLHDQVVLDAHASVSIASEGALTSDTSVAVAKVSLSAKKLGGSIKASSEVVEDWGVNQGIEGDLLADMRSALDLGIDEALFNGTHAYGDSIKADVNVAETTVANVAGLSLVDLDAALAAVKPVKGSRPEVYVNRQFYYGVLCPLLKANNVELEKENGVCYYNGCEIVFSDALAGPSASTSGDLLMVVGYLRNSVVVGSRGDVKVQEFTEVLANTDEVLYAFSQRGDIKIYAPEHLAKVALA